MNQRPAFDAGGSRDDSPAGSQPQPKLEPPATLASFDKLLSSADPEPDSGQPAADSVDGRIPDLVLRQWSDALAAAGLYAEALVAHPAVEREDLVRRAELAVLVGDHLAALSLLAELREAGTPR